MSRQLEAWSGSFGEEYVSRNPATIEEYEQTYLDNVGVTKTSLNEELYAGIPKSARILEVGTNVGMQLALLSRAGYQNLYGVEIQWKAIDVLRTHLPRTNVVHASAYEIPFRDNFFDVVFTSGVLIHIDPSPANGGPSDLERAMREIHRCSRRWIIGDEYYADELSALPYRGETQMMWKGNYPQEYKRLFPELRTVRERKLPHVSSSNVDIVYVLEKTVTS